jgi:nucleotide-binding universal stress UspA family protein
VFRQILIPLDGSDLSQRVLAPLRHMLGGDEVGTVTLLRVLVEGEDAAPARADLDRLVGLLSASGVPAKAQVAEGEDASQAIIRVAEELRSDLVAMATHGHSGLTRLIRGSVAERVLRRCTRPLLLCNPKVLHSDQTSHEGFRRILVPYDGSELAGRILDRAADMARIYDAELVLFKVENFATDGPHKELRPIGDVLATLEPVKERLLAGGVAEVHIRAVQGSPVVEILKAVETLEVDLLALTTHGRSGASRWWFGSVAEALVREAPCPLFVLRVGASA